MTTHNSTANSANGMIHPSAPQPAVANGEAHGATPPPPVRNGYSNGATPPPPRRPVHIDNGGPKLPEDVNPILMDVLVGTILVALYLFCTQDCVAAAPASAALLAVVLWRLSSQGRRIAAPVLTIATMMLVAAIAGYQLAPKSTALFTVKPGDVCIPIVVTAILYYTRVSCATAHIMMFLAVGLLASGLLPGDGWLVTFLAARYVFFFLIVTGLLIDFITLLQRGDAPMEGARA